MARAAMIRCTRTRLDTARFEEGARTYKAGFDVMSHRQTECASLSAQSCGWNYPNYVRLCESPPIDIDYIKELLLSVQECHA